MITNRIFGIKKLVVFIILINFSCVNSDFQNVKKEKSIIEREAGDFICKLSFNGLQRTYFLHVPPKSDFSIPAPLVIVLHGATGNGDSLRNNSEIGLNAKGDQKGFVMVYPEGTGDSDNRSYYWNAAHCCGSAWVDNVDDVGFINFLIETLVIELNLDSDSIFVMGFSNGGMMAYRLAAEIPEKIRAISSLAGAIGGQFSPDTEPTIIAKPSMPVSVLIFHGLLDEEVPYNGGNILAAHGRVDLSVRDAVTFWVSCNLSNPTPITETGDYGEYIKDIYYPGFHNGKSVILYTFPDLAHEWPGQIGDKSATDIILDFFDSTRFDPFGNL